MYGSLACFPFRMQEEFLKLSLHFEDSDVIILNVTLNLQLNDRSLF